MRLQPGDTVYVTNTLLGWSSKTFEVQETQFVTYPDRNGKPAFGYDLVLRELDSTAFSWTAASEETELVRPPATNLPNPLVAYPPTSVTLTAASSITLGEVQSRLTLAWTAPTDQYVLAGGQIEIQYRQQGAASWLPVAFVAGSETSWSKFDVVNGGLYEARVRSVNSLGAVSAWVAVNQSGGLVFLNEYTSALQVGNSLAIATAGNPALAALNGTDVAFVDDNNDQLRTYRFDGTDWAQVGNSLAIASVVIPALTALNGTDVAFVDSNNDQLRTYRFNGTDWAQVGNSLAIATVGNPKLAALNGTDVAYFDNTNDQLRTYRFDGTDWAQVGNSLAINSALNPALAALNGTDVAYFDSNNVQLRTYRFDGTDWAQVGNSLAIAGALPALAALNGTDVAYIESGNDQLLTYRFNGTDWAQSGNYLAGISGSASPALAALNGTDVAYIDSNNDQLRTYRFALTPVA